MSYSIISIYTDGAARGNPGRGGYGIVMKAGDFRKELSAGYRHTTNNRMELLSVIVALKNIKMMNQKIEIFSDSKYVCDAVNLKWVFSWKSKNFAGKKNKDLWLVLLELYSLHQITFHWIKGHSGHPENEYCDLLATNAADGNNLLIDTEYEKINPSI